MFLARHRELTQRGTLRLLHIAPEASLTRLFKAIPGVAYLSADRFNPAAMVRMDICAIQYPDASFDAIFCSHVLEHVADNRKAMREFYRTLAPGGWALILVPQSSRAVTDEDNTLTDPAERQRRFGQHDHVRLYGQDFHERLSQAGFRIQVFTTEDLASPVEFAQYGLTRNERLFLCRR